MEEWIKSPGYRKAVTAFVACSKTKRSRACKARDLYQGNLFKKSITFAEHYYSRVYILSAKYGVVHPDEIIEPYEMTLKSMKFSERKEWSEKVQKDIETRDIPKPFVFFTGVAYCEFFEGYKPLKGLSFGNQLQWFNARLSEIKKNNRGFQLCRKKRS